MYDVIVVGLMADGSDKVYSNVSPEMAMQIEFAFDSEYQVKVYFSDEVQKEYDAWIASKLADPSEECEYSSSKSIGEVLAQYKNWPTSDEDLPF